LHFYYSHTYSLPLSFKRVRELGISKKSNLVLVCNEDALYKTLQMYSGNIYSLSLKRVRKLGISKKSNLVLVCNEDALYKTLQMYS
jgi:hypothetical protein